MEKSKISEQYDFTTMLAIECATTTTADTSVNCTTAQFRVLIAGLVLLFRLYCSLTFTGRVDGLTFKYYWYVIRVVKPNRWLCLLRSTQVVDG
jgi:hypothetical protein